MKKKYRIKRNEEFQEIIAKRKYNTSRNFVVYTNEKKEAYTRVGISVPKKTGNAVLRNKVKRQVKEMLRSFPEGIVKKDMIIIIKKAYLDGNYEDNRKDLEKLLFKVKM